MRHFQEFINIIASEQTNRPLGEMFTCDTHVIVAYAILSYRKRGSSLQWPFEWLDIVHFALPTAYYLRNSLNLILNAIRCSFALIYWHDLFDAQCFFKRTHWRIKSELKGKWGKLCVVTLFRAIFAYREIYSIFTSWRDIYECWWDTSTLLFFVVEVHCRRILLRPRPKWFFFSKIILLVLLSSFSFVDRLIDWIIVKLIS